ncbi:hypothetical protein [Longimicrobium sp.]|uniref:hypothetical protein n=1 Tax=Longimicrobium sp. TaxID=2029185 RepID=UPI002E2EF98C|nr:hypothetical protein [Longimicrobium sp.]HEX6036787.1 hypothetical protein [Longimicrobium sp.]
MAEPVRFNALQQRVHRRLGLLGAGPADFFADAVRIMAAPEQLATTSHLVGHLLREIESGLRAVLGIIVEPDPNEPAQDRHEREVRAILRALEFEEGDEVFDRWLFIAGKNAPGGLARRAHRDALNAPRRIDPTFVSQWEEIQLLLDAVLDRFETRYTDVFARLDELLRHANPTKENLRVLKQVVPNTPATRRYFFDRLESPGWLTPLREEGFFDSPPPPAENVEDAVSFPGWPEAEYLARMATVQPAEVLAIIRTVETENVRVQARLIEVLMSFPAAQAADLTPLVLQWQPRMSRYHHGHFVLRFAGFMGASGLSREALVLAGAIFGLPERDEHGMLPIKNAAPTRQRDLDWHLTEAPEALAPLVGAAPVEYITLLANALDYHVGRRPELDEEVPRDTRTLGVRDWSTTWLPRLANTSEARERDLRVLLAAALREALDKALDHGQTVADLVALLRRHEPLVFRRLELDLLARHAETAPGLVAERLTVLEYYEGTDMRDELPSLLRAGFPLLGQYDRDKILERIAAVPDFAWIGAEHRSEAGSRWQRDWLAVIADHLSADWHARLDALVAEHGPPVKIERFDPGYSVWTGPTSPKSEDELRAMSAPEVAAYLGEWEPEAERRSPSRDGLARNLAKVASGEPANFASEAERFIGLAPVYVCALLEGLRNARSGERSFPWEPVLGLGEWIVEQEVPPSDLGEGLDRESDLRWARRQLADLLAQGLGGREAIPLNPRERVWRIISVLAEDLNPSPEFEARSKKTDPSTLAINTVRSEGIHAALRYAFWAAEAHKEEGGPQPGFEVVPEVAELLERHLDPEVDPSLAVRAAVGKLLGHLAIFDPAWTTAHMGRLLPAAPEAAQRRNALWDTYVQWGTLWPAGLAVLEPAYREAIGRVRANGETPPNAEDPEQNLAEHLMQLYWWGTIPLEKPDNLIELFFAHAAPRARKHALRFVGDSLTATGSSVDAEPIELLRTMWEWRTRQLSEACAAEGEPADAARGELAEFGVWFASGAFDIAWSLAQLRAVLQLTGRIEHEVEAIKYLGDISEERPGDAVACLASLDIVGGDDRWKAELWRGEAKEIIRRALRSPDPAVHAAARVLVNRWVALGWLDFRDLLDEPE